MKTHYVTYDFAVQYDSPFTGEEGPSFLKPGNVLRLHAEQLRQNASH
jgi:hypothetical protein